MFPESNSSAQASSSKECSGFEQLLAMDELNKNDKVKVEGGKNNASQSGQNFNGVYTYRNKENKIEEKYVKKPSGKKKDQELFFEFFAGCLIRQFIEKGLIDKKYERCFITADLVRNVPSETGQGEFALVQPFQEFTELHKIAGTSNSKETDRSAVFEGVKGLFSSSSPYSNVNQELNGPVGLSSVLMVSLLIADYSTHSANLAYGELKLANQEITNIMYRFDYGAAFRGIGHQKASANPKGDILLSDECSKSLVKYYFNSYIHYFSDIPGLFYNMGQKAELFSKAGDERLHQAVRDALIHVKAIVNSTPEGHQKLVDEDMERALSDYTGLFQFNGALTQKNDSILDALTEQLVEIFKHRLGALQNLKQRFPMDNPVELSAPLTLEQLANAKEVSSKTHSFSLQDADEFFQKMRQMDASLLQEGKTSVKVDELQKLLEPALNALVDEAKKYNLWSHPLNTNKNIFNQDSIPVAASSSSSSSKQECGQALAFLPHLQEAAILRLMMSLPEMEIEALSGNDDADSMLGWRMLKSFISMLVDVKKWGAGNNGEMDSSEWKEKTSALLECQTTFAQLFQHVAKDKNNVQQYQDDGETFYPISNEELHTFTGKQLMTIVLLELSAGKPGQQLPHIFADNELYRRFSEEMKKAGSDSPLYQLFPELAESLKKQMKIWEGRVRELITGSVTYYLYHCEKPENINYGTLTDYLNTYMHSFIGKESNCFSIAGAEKIIQHFGELEWERLQREDELRTQQNQYIENYSSKVSEFVDDQIDQLDIAMSTQVAASSTTSQKQPVTYETLKRLIEEADDTVKPVLSKDESNLSALNRFFTQYREFSKGLELDDRLKNFQSDILDNKIEDIISEKRDKIQQARTALVNKLKSQLEGKLLEFTTLGQLRNSLLIAAENKALFGAENIAFRYQALIDNFFSRLDDDEPLTYQQLKQIESMLSILADVSRNKTRIDFRRELQTNKTMRRSLLGVARTSEAVIQFDDSLPELFCLVIDNFKSMGNLYRNPEKLDEEFLTICTSLFNNTLRNKQQTQKCLNRIINSLDIKAIKDFCLDKNQKINDDESILEQDKAELRASLDAFQEQACSIIKNTGISEDEKRQQLQQLAHQKFGNSTLQIATNILLDLLMVISMLLLFAGMFWMKKRIDNGQTCFFSMEKPQLEQDAETLLEGLMGEIEVERENTDEIQNERSSHSLPGEVEGKRTNTEKTKPETSSVLSGRGATFFNRNKEYKPAPNEDVKLGPPPETGMLGMPFIVKK